MRDSIVVRGVEMTRGELEKALAVLNTPDPEPSFKAGNVVWWAYTGRQRLMVLGGNLAKIVAKLHGELSHDWVYATDGKTTWMCRTKDLILITESL